MTRYVVTALLEPPNWFGQFEDLLSSCGFKEFGYIASSGPLHEDCRIIRYSALGDESCVLMLRLKLDQDRLTVSQFGTN